MVSLDSLSGLASNQSQNLQKANTRLQIAIAALATGDRSNRASDAIAELAIATQLQTNTSSLKQASGSLAQVSSLAQVADGGLEQIQESLVQLKELATQANSPVLSQANRQQLNAQFQQLKANINQIAQNTSFGGEKLLNGDLSGDRAISLNSALGIEGGGEGDQTLSLESFAASDLFNGQNLDILSAGSASQALGSISAALDKVIGARANVGSFQKSADFAAAGVNSAVANQQAAESVFLDADFAETSTEFSLANVLRNATLALAAQGNRLNPSLVGLLVK